ncbi:hypothetical protein JRO89_XS04G0168100 [Xanthoceras sorbifolium]|uniref:Uncharacterized protein n=1 Tax=Xanthoceras sorbifolium TaxID=99658 RepID=A0ABQ8I5V1_9ROSI|nr:hypothetical protein JRO89_XS04G0168100 [Xanthoceras sorbifolium]
MVTSTQLLEFLRRGSHEIVKLDMPPFAYAVLDEVISQFSPSQKLKSPDYLFWKVNDNFLLGQNGLFCFGWAVTNS